VVVFFVPLVFDSSVFDSSVFGSSAFGSLVFGSDFFSELSILSISKPRCTYSVLSSILSFNNAATLASMLLNKAFVSLPI